MKSKIELRDAWTALMAARSFVLACHQRPDGDTLGSALAVSRALRAMSKDVVVLSEDGVPENYRFVPESDTILRSTGRRDFEAGVLVDSEGIKRVGSAAEPVTAARMTACIDHHVPDDEFGDVRIVDPAYSAAAELALDLLDANDVPIDNLMAWQLLTGIVSDTGAFRYANTTASALRAAARLIDLGADPSVIAREVYESRPLGAARLLGRALASLETENDGRIVIAVVTHADFQELGAADEDTDGIVNHVRAVRGTRVALLLREMEPEMVRVSLRSKDGYDVNRVARAFGGGGHVGAAGCTIKAPLDQARRMLIDEVAKWMDS